MNTYFEDLDVYGVDYGFDLAPPQKDPANLADKGTQAGKKSGYRRDYEWNERNLLSRSRDSEKTVTYRYGEDGQRALKFCQQTNSETLYFNNFYSMQQVAHEPNHEQGLRVSKHIFVGNSRLVTALTHQAGIDTTEQAAKLYYYHADHLQSAQFITNAKGEKYEHIEYTPYGELWIEETAPGIDKLPFRFTGKELDTETGLYYYGARYLDPKYSRWLSGDPAIGEYIPQAGADTSKLPNGGVYNTTNLQVFNYGNNNPVKYNDPTGRISMPASAYFEGFFSRASAIAYANMWAYDRNHDYDMRKFPANIIPPSDCANFVSQSLNKGGIKTRDDWYNKPGEFSILEKRTDKNYSQNWTTAKGLTRWLRKEKNIYNGESLIRTDDNFNSDLEKSIEKTKIGDVIGWSTDESGKNIHHVGIVSKIANGKIYYDAHTNDKRNEELTPGDKSIVIIHILDEAY